MIRSDQSKLKARTAVSCYMCPPGVAHKPDIIHQRSTQKPKPLGKNQEEPEISNGYFKVYLCNLSTPTW